MRNAWLLALAAAVLALLTAAAAAEMRVVKLHPAVADKAPDCYEDADCGKSEYCTKDGECLKLKEDGEACKADAECASGACQKTYKSTMVCNTPCKADKDCPKDKPICNMSPYGMPMMDGKAEMPCKKNVPRKLSAEDDAAPSGGGGSGGGSGKAWSGHCVECLEDKDCGAEEYCQPGYKKDAHTCMKYGPVCKKFGDCPSGEYCDDTLKRCRPYGLVAEMLAAGAATA